MTGPIIARTRDELDAALWSPEELAGVDLDAYDDGDEEAPRRAVVMTMGALHDGHLALVRAARAAVGPQGQVVVTDFVNPLQFGPGEDYERYPRDLDADLAALARGKARVDVVFAPSADEMYPSDPIVRVTAGTIGTVLEGAVRPGHFDGVLTVVLKLLNLVAPDIAVFGEKDAQQLLAIRRMVSDLELPVEILGVPIVREPDGLALSSRNSYLSRAEHAQALALSRALQAGVGAGDRGADAVRAAAAAVLEAAGVVPDYLVCVDPTTVEDVPASYAGSALLLVAARLGSTRLIDNMAVTVTQPSAGDAQA
ncbi:pantoate--beta-alanine ligase [Sanguibacter sp. A247]|uniref:pantoate--beta-alanine ligase n=1 Tax=unclassified Sanguibacter TaxID=2645534 RepID=UPI003FD8C8AD